ncbi:mitochondrial cytochrome c oxidase subunit VIa [Daldinia loculata]|uniref:mitochondrial cytochrome c oxidase subunit VIa n=1 Tax=Daldinia loculata TaxID=103429 RepID=UPI0020C2F538|nr:mitochondrial cytochrome c oxidase subunit VIa [Daldinia loculata]KAI1650989.1 mitochondrial cytochrome c oxidase subunit VIa [Daldinia loculata]
MLPQRQLLRATPRLASQLRAANTTPVFRSALQRRFASTENAFIKERQAVKEHAAATTELWRKISLYVVPPAILLAGVNAYNLYQEHWEHWSHLPPLEERVEYPYQNIRTKNFPWGDGDKTLFWNDKVNYHNKNKTT